MANDTRETDFTRPSWRSKLVASLFEALAARARGRTIIGIPGRKG